MFIAGIEIFFGFIVGGILLALGITVIVCGVSALKMIGHKIGRLIPQCPEDGFTSQPSPPKSAS